MLDGGTWAECDLAMDKGGRRFCLVSVLVAVILGVSPSLRLACEAVCAGSQARAAAKRPADHCAAHEGAKPGRRGNAPGSSSGCGHGADVAVAKMGPDAGKVCPIASSAFWSSSFRAAVNDGLGLSFRLVILPSLRPRSSLGRIPSPLRL